MSTGASTIIPTLRYRQAGKAITWLCEAFGLHRHLVVEGEGERIDHAQLSFPGGGMIMLGSVREDDDSVAPGPASFYVVLAGGDAEVDAHCARARAAGAEITMAPEDQDYGGRLYSCRDLEGNIWAFGSYDPWAQPQA